MIIAVGCRIFSTKATKFRQWATKILNEYIKKGLPGKRQLKSSSQRQTIHTKDHMELTP